ncbi:MAG: S-layer homology domain-containing protein [Syntrophomonas sp.]|nr:S-layer homology domain-containing protein [Syntrophomonas sp.]
MPHIVNVTGDYQVSGLVGDNKDGEITNSYATGAVKGTNYVGGLVGYNDCGEITNSYATSAVAGDFSVGGLVGMNFDYSDDTETITDSYASGDVTGTAGVGGLVGENNNGAITNSYATGAVTGIGDDEVDVVDVGGLVGYNEGVITNSYATGAVTGTGGDVIGVGGLVGINDQGTITASFWDTETSGMKSSAGGDDAVGETTEKMKKKTTFENKNWDFIDIWNIDGIRNNGYPFLIKNPPVEPENPLTITAATGGSITIGSSGNYAAGTIIDISATPASGYSFNKWTSTGGGTFADANKASTTYTMPTKPATITATFTYNSSSGGSSGGGGSTTPSGTQVTPSGRTTSQNGVTLTFPAGAVESDIRVQVKEIALSAGMTMPENSQLLSHVIDIVKDKSGNFLKPVTITLSFNNSELDPNEYDIAIYYYDEETGKWIALDNIRLNSKTGTISGDTTHFTKFAVIATPKTIKEEKPAKPVTPQLVVNIPTDISGHWAKDSIMKMINAGVISGYPDGTFKPDKAVTRAEFTVMIVKALNLETRTGKTFTDTTSHWAKESIATAAAHGIISGYDENTFGPDNMITREQAAVIVSRAAQLEAETGELNFTDSKAISPWAQPGVAAAFKAGFISGYPDGSFKPQGNTTRAEAAIIIGKSI